MQVLILGAGQLAKMLALAGAPLGFNCFAYDVNTDTVIHPVSGITIDQNLKQAIKQADVITAEFEHIPEPILSLCEKSHKLVPNANNIRIGGDRRLEKALMKTAKIKTAPYCIIETEHDLQLAIDKLGLPLVFKTALGGYDGKGQWRLKDDSEKHRVWQELQAALLTNPKQGIIAEAFIPFTREVSLIGVRNSKGEIACYPLVCNQHANGVLALSATIESIELQMQAENIFKTLSNKMNYVGLLAIEFFEHEHKLIVNEIAPRVHNSGHWTQNGAEICQFENHLRAIANYPLGSTALTQPSLMVNLLGSKAIPSDLLSMQGLHLHWYGKEPRDGRKMGHINLCANYEGELDRRLKALLSQLPSNEFPYLADLH